MTVTIEMYLQWPDRLHTGGSRAHIVITSAPTVRLSLSTVFETPYVENARQGRARRRLEAELAVDNRESTLWPSDAVFLADSLDFMTGTGNFPPDSEANRDGNRSLLELGLRPAFEAGPVLAVHFPDNTRDAVIFDEDLPGLQDPHVTWGDFPPRFTELLRDAASCALRLSEEPTAAKTDEIKAQLAMSGYGVIFVAGG